MGWAGTLTRDDLLENLESYRAHPEFLEVRDMHLRHAVHSKDLVLVQALLKAGAGPDYVDGSSDSLQHDLVHEFQSVRSTQGATVFAILEALLAHGADPNYVGCNNQRAVGVAMRQDVPMLVELFVRFGADPAPRSFI